LGRKGAKTIDPIFFRMEENEKKKGNSCTRLNKPAFTMKGENKRERLGKMQKIQ